MRSLAALLVALLAAPAAAQNLTYSNDATLSCLAGAGPGPGRMACVGASADTCMSATPSGDTTVGMGGCLDLERRFWDGELNRAYGDLMARARAQDAEMQEIGATVPKLVPALRDMQRGWIAFRDLTCDFERAQWGGGTGGGPATLSCLMRLTAQQAMYLQDTRIGE